MPLFINLYKMTKIKLKATNSEHHHSSPCKRQKTHQNIPNHYRKNQYVLLKKSNIPHHLLVQNNQQRALTMKPELIWKRQQLDDALTCVFKFGMSVQEALRVTKQECTKQYLHRRVKEVKDIHGKSCGSWRQIGIGIPLKSINGTFSDVKKHVRRRIQK